MNAPTPLTTECLALAAPALLATDTTAMHHIRTYVTALETKVADLAQALADIAESCGEPNPALRSVAEQHRDLVAFHANRPLGAPR